MVKGKTTEVVLIWLCQQGVERKNVHQQNERFSSVQGKIRDPNSINQCFYFIMRFSSQIIILTSPGNGISDLVTGI